MTNKQATASQIQSLERLTVNAAQLLQLAPPLGRVEEATEIPWVKDRLKVVSL